MYGVFAVGKYPERENKKGKPDETPVEGLFFKNQTRKTRLVVQSKVDDRRCSVTATERGASDTL